MGWVTVVAYFVAAFFCWRCAVVARAARPDLKRNDERFFWMSFVAVLILLGINKQLDLQTWLTETGRYVAIAGGWYERRQVFQVGFIAACGLGGMTAFAAFCFMSRRVVRQHLLPLAGGLFLICFVLMRAASFHHFDQMIGRKWGDLKMNWVLELGGIGCVALGALRNLARQFVARQAMSQRPRPAAVRPPVRRGAR